MDENSTPTMEKTEEVLKGLNDLLQLDHDALGAYEIAIEKLDDPELAQQIRGFRMDHERHIELLNQAITTLGGTPTNEPHATGPFKEALQKVGAVGGDAGVLSAFRVNELQARTKYDSYASRAMRWPREVKKLIDENALDEERHYRWVADTMEAMGIGEGEDFETNTINRVRETLRSKAGTAERARRRLSETAGEARLRAADALDVAADKLDGAVSQYETAGGARGRAAQAGYVISDSFEHAAERLRYQGELDVEAQAREHPLRTMLFTVAAGYTLGRLLR